ADTVTNSHRHCRADSDINPFSDAIPYQDRGAEQYSQRDGEPHRYPVAHRIPAADHHRDADIVTYSHTHRRTDRHAPPDSITHRYHRADSDTDPLSDSIPHQYHGAEQDSHRDREPHRYPVAHRLAAADDLTDGHAGELTDCDVDRDSAADRG